MFKIITLSILLTGCAGRAAYEAEPIEVAGKVVCCKISVYNNKDIDLVEVKYESKADGSTSLHVKEKGVKTNAAVAAENQAKLLNIVTSILPVIKQWIA